MKTKSKIKIVVLAVMSLTLVITGSCKKSKPAPPNDGTVKDADGNVYTTVSIGEQVWMVENLKTTKYNDGTEIFPEPDNAKWAALQKGAYCWYNNDDKNKTPYGALYNFYAVETGKLCPIGWHVPGDEEWKTLEAFLGGELIAGGELKEKGTTHWGAPNVGATNGAGFTALPGGYRTVNGYSSIGGHGFWWSSTLNAQVNTATTRFIGSNKTDFGLTGFLNTGGLSVRCIKDK